MNKGPAFLRLSFFIHRLILFLLDIVLCSSRGVDMTAIETFDVAATAATCICPLHFFSRNVSQQTIGLGYRQTPSGH